MTTIPKKEYPGAQQLTPLEMNKIPFSTGRHSAIPPKSTPAASSTVKPADDSVEKSKV